MPGAYEIYAKEASLHAQIRALQQRSAFFLTNDELSDLDTYAKRIRGEVFFARAWLLCEGQSEFMLVSYFAELLATPLDRHGITVIDFQNNGSPGAFVKLATNLGIPWILLCDDDDAGKSYVRTIKQFGLPENDMTDLVRPLPLANADLERFLIASGFLPELLAILTERGIVIKSKAGDAGFEDELAKTLRSGKTEYVMALIQTLRNSEASPKRVPAYFERAINDVVKKAL